jgi:hypothetical protein
MDFLGSFKPNLNLVTTVGLGMATGGTSLLAEAALRSVVSAIGQQVIQQMGTQMGLPQAAIDLAQGAFAGQIGDFGGQFQNYQEAISSFAADTGASPVEQGAANSAAENLSNMALDNMRNAADEAQSSGEGGGSSRMGKGGSLLMKIAIALGQLMDKKMTEMANLTDEIGALGSDSSNQSKLGELTGKLQGLSQETSLLSNALTNTIKTIGESNSTLARKG